MSIDFNLNVGEELILENQFVVDKNYIKDYNNECRKLYNRHIGYVIDYHKDIRSPFFIGLEKDMIDNLDKCFSNEDMIVLEDWRMCNGSNYYNIYKKQFKKFISLRDILEQLKNNNDLLSLKHNRLNSYIILIDIHKKCNSNIHYELFFHNYY